MSKIAKAFSTEIIKSKNTFALWLTFIGAAIIPLMVLITYVYNWQLFIPKIGENPWKEIFIRSFNGITLFTPLFIILIIGLLFNIEHKANSWKHIFVLPISKSNVFVGKYLFVFFLIFFYFVIFVLLTLAIGYLLGVYEEQLFFLNFTPDWSEIFSYLTKFFTSVMAIVGIHFWLSFRIKNLIANLGIGLAGLAFAIILNGKGSLTLFLPYSFPIKMLNYESNSYHFLEQYHIVSLIYFIVLSCLSYLDFTKRFKG
ncbi:MAG: ABC transporter permease [Bacteroidota bacterium]